MKKTIIVMCGFTILFATIFYEAQIFIKVGMVYEVPFQNSESILSELNIDVDEERIKSRAIEVLSNLFEDEFRVSEYEVSVNTVRESNDKAYYRVYFYNTRTQMEGYIFEFEVESGEVSYIWNNEFAYSNSNSDKEQMSEEKLQKAAEGYFNKLNIDGTDDFKLSQKVYLMQGIQFVYVNEKHSEEIAIILEPETAEFMCYVRQSDL